MAAANQPFLVKAPSGISNTTANAISERAIWERRKSLVLRAWIASGLFFMAIPGTLLGFSNLIAISSRHGLGALPQAWLEGHGHAQIFGWIGSFVLGIGFYSQPTRGRSSINIPLVSLVLWVAGVALRWTANIYLWHWRLLLPVSAACELIAFAMFLAAASRHKMPEQAPVEDPRRGMAPWMALVFLGTVTLAAAVTLNFVECLRLALHGAQPAFPHALDQKYLLLLGWGFIVPTVWGFSARWFSAMLSVGEADAAKLRLALALVVIALGCGLFGFTTIATVLLTLSAVVVVDALHLVERPKGPAKVHGIHPSFPFFVRTAYLWLLIAAGLSIWAARGDVHGGIWGASRHALTVGFAATMVFTIGPRILPHFAGVRALFSPRLMFLCLLFLQTGCTLRVVSEPLAYEGFSGSAWQVLPVSGILELSAVLLFALNLALTFLGRAGEQRAQSMAGAALVNISSSHRD